MLGEPARASLFSIFSCGGGMAMLPKYKNLLKLQTIRSTESVPIKRKTVQLSILGDTNKQIKVPIIPPKFYIRCETNVLISFF